MDSTEARAAFGYRPGISRQGERAGASRERLSDYWSRHNSVTAFLAGLLGVAPDELSGSVMDPERERNKAIAEPAFYASSVAQAIPAVGALTKLMNVVGSSGKVGASAAKQIGAAGPFDVGSVLYRGLPRLSMDDLAQYSGLRAMDRTTRGPSPKANVRDFSWSTDNPKVSSSYAHTRGGVIPLEIVEKPSVILDAQGKHWEDYFFDRRGNPLPASRNPFYDAMRDPAIKSIGVKNIIDPGVDAFKYADEFSELLGNNLLIKDPSVVRYLLSGETAKFAQGGSVRRGGLAQVKECSCGR